MRSGPVPPPMVFPKSSTVGNRRSRMLRRSPPRRRPSRTSRWTRRRIPSRTCRPPPESLLDRLMPMVCRGRRRMARAAVSPPTPPPPGGTAAEIVRREAAAVKSDAQREQRALDQAGAQLLDAVRQDPPLKDTASQIIIDNVPEGLRIQIVDAER